MKKISLAIMVLVVTLASCKKTPEVNLKYVDVERDLITVGMTTATVQCDYQYIATLKKAYFYYGEGENEVDMNKAEMHVVQNTLYVDLTDLRPNTTYSYYYEFYNGFNSMRTATKTFKTEADNGGGDEPPTPPEITLPTVITAEVTGITTNAAQCGGEVVNDGGAEVTERGICWGTNENPTLNDSHHAAGMGIGTFTAMMNGLEANITYHVRAYATNEKGTAYGLDKEFTTLSGGSSGGDHEWVDLGLPSGLLWATCNVGANSPEEYGDYFAWGETQPKTTYNLYSYIHFSNNGNFLITKYCNNSEYGYNGYVDNLTILLPEDDAASANWGDDWRMPTKDEWQELLQNTTNIWTAQDGVNGRRFTGTNGNSIFIPASGFRLENDLVVDNYNGYCWTSSLSLDCPTNAWYLCFGSFAAFVDPYNGRHYGYPVRPVRGGNTPTPSIDVPEGAINGLFTIHENGDKVYFSKGNLQYQASTNTWRFAENQWDFVGSQNPHSGSAGGTVSGSDNINISPTYSGWIDLFGWGTSGWNCGNTYYQPWSSADYQESNHGELYGPHGEYNLIGEYKYCDWGVYNAISNGGNQAGLWRTLTIEEWNYLFHLRSTASNIRFVKADVAGVNGVIILPDDWNSTIYTLNETDNGDADYSCNVINISKWMNVFEANNAVFLPASGYRGGNMIDYINTQSVYWSASYGNSNCACNVGFYKSFYYIGNDIFTRHFGLSVRLVQDATP